MKIFDTILKPSESVGAAFATAGLVYGIYQMNLPSMTEIHGAMPHNDSVDAARKKAMWSSVAAVSGFSLLTKDPNVFTAGAIMFLILEWSTRHANATHPQTGALVPTSAQVTDALYSQTPTYEDGGDSYNG